MIDYSLDREITSKSLLLKDDTFGFWKEVDGQSNQERDLFIHIYWIDMLDPLDEIYSVKLRSV